ncbi:unnamed protein product [Rotaria sp. Silwood1]|nr:unnamed protein product [Rotaria sp. Silwood1]CAF1190019.1 unnamed protein product [Rotaria sp. Silwood1]CAF4784555.1 unnamed protein product [Rotaria sp. Silwood1]CAF4807813.1 unnamed protein product [Rotaria sp. Silwood1]CAF4823123.1 unnamed protein product [Rotaria sp. Silwood1]
MILFKVSNSIYHSLLDSFDFSVTVRGATSSDRFKGILLVAKDASDQNILGSWSSINSSVQVVSCDGTLSNGITHTSSTNKSQIQATWRSPSTITEKNIVIK